MEVIHKHFSIIDSTNNYAKRQAHLFERNRITLLTADEQITGRGRGKRQWFSPANQNVYATFCSFFPKSRTDIGNISQLLALSAIQVLESLHFHPVIKWPNDILLVTKKLGGILCETIVDEQDFFVINGIGINVNMTQENLDKIDIPATSLMTERGSSVDYKEILKALAERYVEDLQLFHQNGFAPFLSKFRQLTNSYMNRKVKFNDHLQVVEGHFHSINEDGSLNLLLPTNEIKSYLAGQIIE